MRGRKLLEREKDASLLGKCVEELKKKGVGVRPAHGALRRACEELACGEEGRGGCSRRFLLWPSLSPGWCFAIERGILGECCGLTRVGALQLNWVNVVV